MITEIDSALVVRGLNNSFLIAKNNLHKKEILAAKGYVVGLERSSEAPRVGKLRAVIQLLEDGAERMRVTSALFLALEIEEARINLTAVTAHLQKGDLSDAA